MCPQENLHDVPVPSHEVSHSFFFKLDLNLRLGMAHTFDPGTQEAEALESQ